MHFIRTLRACTAAFGICTSLQAATPPATQPTRESYRKYAMVHQGDAERGKALFFDQQKIVCSQCHTVDAKGGKAGPDLFAVGDKFGRDDLIDQVLNPSATIAVGYSTTMVQTKSGETYVGIVKQSNDKSVGLMNADGKDMTFCIFSRNLATIAGM